MRKTYLSLIFASWLIHPAVAATQAEWDVCTADDFEKSISACSRIIGSTEEQPSYRSLAFYTRGVRYSLAKRYDEAIQDLNEALKLNPDHAEAYHERGVAFSWKQNFEEAIKNYTRALKLKPDMARTYAARGNALRLKNETARALEDYDMAIRLAPSDSNTLLERGKAYYNAKAYDSAIQDYDRLISLQPGLAATYYERGLALTAKNDFDRALADFDKVVSLNPDQPYVHAWRGQALLFKRDYSGAIESFTRAIAQRTGDVDPYLMRAATYQAQNELEKALADYNTALGLSPTDPRCHQGRAGVRVQLGDYDRALVDYEDAAKLFKETPLGNRFYRGRGLAYAGKGDHDRAMADYDKALELQPNDPTALYRRGLSRLAKGDVARAIADHARADAIIPQGVDLQAESDRRAAKQQLDALLRGFGDLTSEDKPLRNSKAEPAIRRVALVIGNNAYRGNMPVLATPRDDAKAIAAALRRAGLGDADVVEAYDLDRKAMIATLKGFEAKAANADWSIVFFAGHGVRARSNQDFLIPIDAEITQERDLADEAVALERVVERIHDARKLQLVILDACRDNELSRKLYSNTERTRSGTASVTPIEAPGLMIAFSARRGQQAYDGKLHSPFAEALLAGLDKPDTPLNVMFEAIQAQVRSATDGGQIPEIFGLDYGRALNFNQGSRPTAAASQTP